MPDRADPNDTHAVLTAIEELLASLTATRNAAPGKIVTLDAEQTSLGYHPHYPAYAHGGLYTDKGFGAGQILALAGFHVLDWRAALDRLECIRIDPADDPACLLVRLRHVCEADAMLEDAGFAWCDEHKLLKRGAIDPFWLRRPKFGLGQAAMAAGLTPEQSPAHRGLYALPIAVLRRGFETVAVDQRDRRFGAMLPGIIETGGTRLARIGADALHRDAAARYHADCRSFAEHQAATQDRRWRWKPPLSRQGHLAVTTSRANGAVLPAERTRGHAANWLGDHDANIRFTGGDEA